MTTIDKSTLIDLLTRFVAQRPRLEFGNYGDVATYRAESRSITEDMHDAMSLIRYIAIRDSITVEDLLKALDGAFSGRLQLAYDKKGQPYLDYCVGQYWPTEYRRAVAAVCASAIWDWLRANSPTRTGDDIRAAARRELGRTIAQRWFR